MQSKHYFKNAAILTATGLLLRAAGMFFRIYIAARVGAEGMGLYQLIYTVYSLAITLATAGLSVASTRICADYFALNKPGAARKAMQSILLLGFSLGVAAALLLFFGAPLAGNLWLQDERAALSLRILAPSLPFMALSAVLRGYFMARREVGPNSQAQILEQVIRIGIVALVLDSASQQSVSAACAAIVFGNTISEVVSWIYMEISYRRDLRQLPRQKEPVAGLRRTLWGLLAPITANQYLTSTLRTIENVMVPACLAGYTLSRELALSQYGALKGMAMPVLFFPFSFLGTLSTLLLPEITEAYVQRRYQSLTYLINRVILLTLSISVLAGGLFTLFAYPIGEILYKSAEIGFYIMLLGPIAPFMYLESMVDGILKGLNQQLSTFHYSALDSVVRIALIWFLLPRMGMKGFLFVMIVSNLLTSILNFRRLLTTIQMRVNWLDWVVKPIFSFVCAGVFFRFVMLPLIPWHLSTLVSTILGCVVISLFYGLMLLLTGCIRFSDFFKKKTTDKK